MSMRGPARSPAARRGSRAWSRRQRRSLHGSASGSPAGTTAAPDTGPGRRRRTLEERRRRRSNAFDLLAVVAALALVGFGLANLYLIGESQLAARQGLIAAAGVLALAAFWRVRVRYLGVLGWAAYGAAVLLLVGVLAVGLSANGATRWIAIGSFTFQPSELAKLGLLLVLAAVLGSSRPAVAAVHAAVLLAVVPIGLTLLQPDLSTTMLLVVLTASMLVLGRVPARFLLPLGAAAAISAPLMISLLQPYQLERLGTFLVGAQESSTGSGWALRQAHIARGLGRAVRADGRPAPRPARAVPARAGHRPGALQPGRAVGAGGRRRRRCSPRSSWCGGSRWPAGRPARRTARWSAADWRSCWAWRPSSRSAANLGLLPLAGVPFPLVSYGGTALVVHLAAIGVVLSVRQDGARRRLWARAAMAQPPAAAGPAGRRRRCRCCCSPSGSTDGGCRPPKERLSAGSRRSR